MKPFRVFWFSIDREGGETQSQKEKKYAPNASGTRV